MPEAGPAWVDGYIPNPDGTGHVLWCKLPRDHYPTLCMSETEINHKKKLQAEAEAKKLEEMGQYDGLLVDDFGGDAHEPADTAEEPSCLVSFQVTYKCIELGQAKFFMQFLAAQPGIPVLRITKLED